MKLIFPENIKSDCTILKETKKYITFRCKGMEHKIYCRAIKGRE